jgi:hypothetical protein
MMLTKESIINLLKTDKRAIARALVVLHDRQTFDEQAQEGTRYLNGRGFRPCHARMGSSMAKQFRDKGFLTDRQINYWRVPDKTGAMRIGIYWAQLLEEAQAKASTKSAIAKQVAKEKGIPVVDIKMNHGYPTGDAGNDMERKMILQEQLDDVLDSDDPTIIDPIANEISAIDAFWAKLKKKQET